MPPSILALPEEILDPIMEGLLPGYGLNSSFLDTCAYEQPVDLLRCRLVCRRLFRHASRWLCRVVRLKLYFSKKQFRVRGAPFTRPEYASNTRVLHIASSTGFRSYGTWQGFPPPTNSSLFPRMINLRILVVQLCPTLVREILPQLLPLPMLHTVILEGSETTVDSANWSRIGGPFPHIKKLDFRRTSDIGPLIALSPTLEELAVRPFTGVDEVLSSITIPWHTLRQLTLENVLEFEKTCVALMENYQNMTDNDGFRGSLTGLMVTQNLTLANAHRLLTAFSGRPLRSLIFGSVVNLEIRLVERVAAMFPKLQEFALFKTSVECNVSSMELDQYATVLGRLRELQVLHLNWIRYHDDDHVWLGRQLDRILVPIVSQCLKLTQVRFMHQGDGISTIAVIIRDQRGQYKSYACETHGDRWSSANAAWDGSNYVFI